MSLFRLLPSVLATGLAVAALGAQDRGVSLRPQSAEVKTGPYHGLLIAVQNYGDEAIPRLDRPIADARELIDVLTTDYQFDRKNVQLLVNPTREGILGSLFSLSEQLGANDNLLVFYAGHGLLDERTQQGYWLPSDARRSNRAQWISNGDIRDALRRIKTKHTLLISDACFAGGILRTRDAFGESNGAGILRLYDLLSRKAMTSGAKEVVPDRSRFVEYLVKRLRENRQPYLPAADLFANLRTAVMNNSPTTPQYGTIYDAGDEGGDFLFPLKPKPAPIVDSRPSTAPVAEIPSRGIMWKNVAGSYWLYSDGQRVSATVNLWVGDNLLVFDPLTKRYFLFEDYKTRDDGQYRPARVIEAPDVSLWRHLDTTYWLYQDGKALTGLVSARREDDLLVYDPVGQQHYVLYEYKKYADGALRPAERLMAPDGAVWSGLDSKFWLYEEGARSVTANTIWEGDNLVACMPSGKAYSLENFARRQDGRFRPARRVTLDRAVWKGNGKQFWLYVDCSSINERIRNVFEGDNLLVYDPVDAKTYYLENFSNHVDGRLRPARVLQAPNNAFWKHTGTSFWIYVDGQSFPGALSVREGNNLLAYVPDSRRYYLFENYDNSADGQLRAARYIAAPDFALWKRTGNTFWLFVEGKALSGLSTSWEGANLIVTDPASNRRYLLPDYRNRDDSKLWPATLMKGTDH